MLKRAMMLGNWLTKSGPATLGVKPSFGTKTRPPRSAASSSSSCFGSSGSAFCSGINTPAVSEFHLHVRDSCSCCCSRCVLDWQLGDSCQFPESGEIAFLRNEGILLIDVDTPEECCCTCFEKYASVAHIAARS